MKYTAVFFDFGHTLAPENPLPVAERIRQSITDGGHGRALGLRFPGDAELAGIHEACAERAGWPPNPDWEEDYRAYYTRWAELLLEELGAPPEPAAVRAEAFAEAFRDLSDRTRVPFDDTVETLEALRSKGLRLGIVSNNDGYLARRVGYLELTKYFEIVVDSAIVRLRKPEPGIFRHALDAMRLKPEDVLHVGDLYGPDVEGAGGVGIDAVWINREGAEAPRSRFKPKHVIRALKGLLTIELG